MTSQEPSYFDRLHEATNASRNALKGKEVRWGSEYGEFIIEFQKNGDLGLGFDTDGDGKFERQLILRENAPSYFVRDAVAAPNGVEMLQPSVQSYTLFNSIFQAGDDKRFSSEEIGRLTPMAANLMQLPETTPGASR